MEQPEVTMPERLIDEARLVAQATGKLLDIQILNLKCIPLVVFGENLSNEFKIDFDKQTVHFELTGQSDFPTGELKVRMEHMVKYVQRILGNFEVFVELNEKALNVEPDSPARKVRKKPNPGRKKRLRKVRKRK